MESTWYLQGNLSFGIPTTSKSPELKLTYQESMSGMSQPWPQAQHALPTWVQTNNITPSRSATSLPQKLKYFVLTNSHSSRNHNFNLACLPSFCGRTGTFSLTPPSSTTLLEVIKQPRLHTELSHGIYFSPRTSGISVRCSEEHVRVMLSSTNRSQAENHFAVGNGQCWCRFCLRMLYILCGRWA